MKNDMAQLLEQAKKGDKCSLNTIVEKNAGLVWSVVKRFYNRGHSQEDLFQIGNIGLIKAVRKFDSNFGVQFTTYAVPSIMGEIKRFIRDDGMIKVSRSIVELASKAARTREDMSKEMGREPTVAEISDKMNIPKEDLILAFEASLPLESLYAPVERENENSSLLDKIDVGVDYEEKSINNIVILDALKNLSERERTIIILRYFQQKTQSQIAQMLGISQVQVSRIEKRVLLNMRESVGEIF